MYNKSANIINFSQYCKKIPDYMTKIYKFFFEKYVKNDYLCRKNFSKL